jgi:hypothetical protein
MHSALAFLPHGDAGGLALLAAMLLAGLVGGGTHCIAMCGPFVLAQTAARLESVPASQMSEFHRLAGAALAPYHLGRATTYITLGAMAGVVGQTIRSLPGLDWIAAGWLFFAAAMFMAYAVFGSGMFRAASAREGRWGRMLGDLARPMFARPTGLRGYALAAQPAARRQWPPSSPARFRAWLLPVSPAIWRRGAGGAWRPWRHRR